MQGTYNYGGSDGGPHAVTSIGSTQYFYDANGNMKNESGSGSALGDRTFTYTSYDMVEKISRTNGTSAEFKYGPDRSRWQRIYKKADGSQVTTTYLGNVERIENSKYPNEIEWKRNVGGVSITYKTTKNVAEGESALTVLNADKSYLYKDHLGSIDVITNAAGTPTHTMSFDPWGARRAGDANGILAYNGLTPARDGDTLTAIIASLTMSDFVNPVTARGYTGHEMVDDMGIIHMNGRIYDARIGRFLQADPFIQAATNTQSYNRYSYVLNNPLNSTDPSGFISNPLKKLGRAFIRGAVKIFGADVVNFVGNAASVFCGPAAPACAAGITSLQEPWALPVVKHLVPLLLLL